MPEFIIDKPYENSQWAVNDTINFQITLTPSSRVKHLKIMVVNQSQTPVTQTTVIDVSDDETVIKGQHIINNQFLTTGMYYFRVTAIDENNNSVSRFVRIQITELPLKTIALYVVAKHNAQMMNVWRSDSLPMFENVLSLYTDYTGSDICSAQSYFYICGRHTGPLAAYDINSGHQLIWKEDPLLNPPFPWFESMMFDGKYIVAGYTDYRIKGYLPGGTTAFVFLTPEMWPRVFLRHYDALQKKYFFVVASTHFSGLGHSISVFYDVSYSNMQFLLTTWEVKKMFSKSNDEIYMFGNENDQAVMKIYKISQNNTYVLKTFPAGKLYDVIRVRPGVFIISHETGLYMYNYSYNSLTPYGNFQGGGTLAWDAVSDKIFYAKQNSFIFFDFLTQHIHGSINLADSIVRMHILYNK